MKKEIYILGVGNNTIVTIDLAEACGYVVVGLYHYENGRTGEDYFGHKIIGSNNELFSTELKGKLFGISVGDNNIRANLYNKIKECGGEVPTLIHPTVVVSKYSEIGKGVCIHALSVISPNVMIGEDCVVSHNTLISHDVRMGSHCFIASNVVLGAYTEMRDYAFIGSGATVISAKAKFLGEHSIVGAGAVVTKPVEKNMVVVGNPAKPLNNRNQKKGKQE